MQRVILVVGLGNFGKDYEKTFHNMGFLAMDALLSKFGKKLKKAECHALTTVFSYAEKKIVLAKPTTYMNLSGTAVKSLISKYKVELEDVIILYDDVYIDRFTIRAREFGSAGTQKGMIDIIEKLGTEQIKRVRFGIGKEEDKVLTDYVLSSISNYDLKTFDKVFTYFAKMFLEYLEHDDFVKFMQMNSFKI